MCKNIRPLAAFKKTNPETYRRYGKEYNLFEGNFSAKQKENNFYWSYAFFNSEIPMRIDEKPNSFYWKDEDTMQNKCTITEIGRLLLYGWYYDNEKFTLEISRNLYNAYIYKIEHNIIFNDLEFSEAIQHIRDNFIYYYQNEEDLKIYMLKHFFEKEIKAILPEPPERLKLFDILMNQFKVEREANLKKDKNYYYNKCGDYEGYAEYLEEMLEQNYIDHSSFEEHCKEQQNGCDAYLEEINSIDIKYQEDCKNILLKNNLLNTLKEQKQLT